MVVSSNIIIYICKKLKTTHLAELDFLCNAVLWASEGFYCLGMI